LKPWFFQASPFQLLKLENLLRWSFFTFMIKRVWPRSSVNRAWLHWLLYIVVLYLAELCFYNNTSLRYTYTMKHDADLLRSILLVHILRFNSNPRNAEIHFRIDLKLFSSSGWHWADSSCPLALSRVWHVLSNFAEQSQHTFVFWVLIRHYACKGRVPIYRSRTTHGIYIVTLSIV